MAPPKRSADAILSEQLAKYYSAPLGYVMFAFPWDTEKSIQAVKLAPEYQKRFNCEWGPDIWACQFLDRVGEEVRKRGFVGEGAVEPQRWATASGHGIGKSALVAWLTKWILDTRPFSKGTLTANTADQLKTKTWAEVGKWHRLSATKNWFDYNSGRGAMSLSHRNPEWKEKWLATAQTCREENSESFAGQHAAGATSFYIFDEASAVPDKIFEVRDGGTVIGEPMIFDFGNPTRNSGRFFEECVGRFKDRYIHQQIDSRTVAITNKKLHQEWIDDYGIDSDFVKVRILGQFPSAGSLQFIPTADVVAAMQRPMIVNRYAPLVIGVDVARFGDDESVIYPRLGDDARSTMIRRFRGLDAIQLSGQIIQLIREYKALGVTCSALFIDGGGNGGGVVDYLRSLGHDPIEVQFGSSPVDKNTYRFKMDEMWGRVRDALKTRLILPEINSDVGVTLKEQLTQREYGYTLLGNKISLEAKRDMKERLGSDFASPDIADALALTFAQEVGAVNVPHGLQEQAPTMIHDYDPHEEIVERV